MYRKNHQKENMKKNKRFVEMPLQNLVQKIEYKAKLEGIEVEKIGEEYTSGVSSIDKEEINRKYYNKARRIKRGLFKTNSGKIINADIFKVSVKCGNFISTFILLNN